LSGFILLILSSNVTAHEFWFEPLSFKISADKKLKVHEKVGQDFKGNEYVYLESSYKFLNITEAEKTKSVKSRLGDLPAISEDVSNSGLVIISAETTPSEVTYESWGKFSSFIKKQGLDWVLEKHKARNLPEKNFVESYRRFSKSLIKVDDGKGEDRALGLDFEWVLEDNPYTTDKDSVSAKLLWRGQPHPKSLVTVFNKVGERLIKSKLLTNEEGKVVIPRGEGGVFLINSVQMTEASKEMVEERSAVWDSHWASMTFSF